MSSFAAARCQHIKVSGTQCGSPALREKSFCFYHQQNRPLTVECYSEEAFATGEIALPVFEDAHSIQTVIRQVVQMVLQKRIERKTASLLLYALQIASSNLKRMELEKPQPTEVVIDPEALSETPSGVWVVWSDDVAAEFCGALADAAEFAINQGDDWVAVVKGYEYDERQTRSSEIREILITRGVIPA